jgi:hypothetical protein
MLSRIFAIPGQVQSEIRALAIPVTIWSVGPVRTLCHMLISDCVLSFRKKEEKDWVCKTCKNPEVIKNFDEIPLLFDLRSEHLHSFTI